jgi:Domain of unknown function (DUF929)
MPGKERSSSGGTRTIPPGTRVSARPGRARERGGSRAPIPGRAAGRATAGPAAGRRRRKACASAAGGGLIAAAIVVFLLASLLGGRGSAKPAPSQGARPQPATGTYPLPAKAVSQVEGVPVSALVDNAEAELSGGQAAPPEKLPATTPQLSSADHPEIIFICAEYWAQCAAERWAFVMALSKFGTFTKLPGTTSSTREADPGTPTFSFYRARYSSKYLSLVTDELETSTYSSLAREYPLLQFPTRQEMDMISTWDITPYTSKAGSIPFAYIGGKFLITSAQYSASAISQMNFQTAAGIMTSGKTAVSRNAEAAAGYLVGDFCALSHEQPTSVCTQVPSSLIGITTSTAKLMRVES